MPKIKDILSDVLYFYRFLLSLGSLSGSSLGSGLGGSGLLLSGSLLCSLELFLLLSGRNRLNSVTGACLGAHGAALALVIVDDSHIVDNMDGVELAGTLAHTAANAGSRADLGHSRALVLVGAVDEHLLGVGNLHDQLAGASLTAGAAVGALILIDDGSAVLADMDGIELTGSHAGAETEAAVLTTDGVTAADLGSSQAVLDTAILKVLGDVVAAVAQHVCDHLFAGRSFHAHDGSNLGSRLSAGRRTGIHGSLALEDGGSAAVAAGIAAAAAVRAGEAVTDQGQTLVDLDLKDFGGDGKNHAERDGDDAQNEDGK